MAQLHEKIHRINVGDAELVSLQDSWAAVPPTGFFTTTQSSDWDAYSDLLDEDGNITLNLGSWLIISQGRTILVDSGIGGRPVEIMPLKETPALPDVLRESGVAPEEIDIVAFTHLHFDHTGWNTTDVDGAPQPLFANARHIVQQAEWDFWTSTDELKQGAGYDNVLAPVLDAGLIDFVEGEHVLTSEVVTVPTPGHTPGHVSFAVNSGGESAYVIGDAAHHMVQLTETDWCPSADVDPATSTTSRRALFDRIEQENALILSGHFKFPGIGRAARADGRRRFAAS